MCEYIKVFCDDLRAALTGGISGISSLNLTVVPYDVKLPHMKVLHASFVC